MKLFKNLAIFKAIAGIPFIGGAMTVGFSVAPANAQRVCQCTDYVANRYNLTRNYPNAGDWDNGYLQKNGLRRVAARPGAIAVMERSFPGANTVYGHVGIVERVKPDGRIDLRGGHQTVGSSFFSEAGCSNVRITGFLTPINRPDISFWAR
ncbi:CHAP domain-containing protein [Aetokthonos hydrillicola Thurmond2011]|jgi:hypothetical protein|uniref:CHAP domain-containing protein n=1 Tax=Aetokthonos hydrillicola Thurmond2011 TaxID=2712845 RepID=A0AAP5M9N8_9CYAN|nr:CHAP domain-containing protein [Aetokthonos hydrillicola]MBO3462418.1 CHAP domain-containing protein [Aetokthonos hydrillicola CCALA 1050]MBW4590626.1 CHAP domain-containing protein [Aetokthonos hydrillicola CCALA 1050]MDR9900366.1 CHAP domain-containing protein [Aetokthonos hydrillicola Thurmond2011]